MLDMFGIQDKSEDNYQSHDEFYINPPLKEPQALRELVSSICNPIKTSGGLSNQKEFISQQDLKHSLKVKEQRNKVKVEMTKIRAINNT